MILVNTIVVSTKPPPRSLYQAKQQVRTCLWRTLD